MLLLKGDVKLEELAPGKMLVVDPVMVSTSGHTLLQERGRDESQQQSGNTLDVAHLWFLFYCIHLMLRKASVMTKSF